MLSFSLALPDHAAPIAAMSRTYIEHGLGWSWTRPRVLRAIRDPATNVVVALDAHGRLHGFGIMKYGEDLAHLTLLAVEPAHRHQHLGARLLGWLETSARAAGIQRIRVEARADNPNAIAFYQRQGFRELQTLAGYYQGTVDAVRLEKNVSQAAAPPA
ncbi:MAG TPA: GNAT family N-acetyltransferase [Ramlibacter sp.]|nr:GNAT family N-acetyltransferase [Ramlibacter sp.]